MACSLLHIAYGQLAHQSPLQLHPGLPSMASWIFSQKAPSGLNLSEKLRTDVAGAHAFKNSRLLRPLCARTLGPCQPTLHTYDADAAIMAAALPCPSGLISISTALPKKNSCVGFSDGFLKYFHNKIFKYSTRPVSRSVHSKRQ
jgi:hypothetical protein